MPLLCLSCFVLAQDSIKAEQLPPGTTKSEVPIQFKKKEHNFGPIPYATPSKYNFVFRNVSDKPVTIQKVKVSCGCTGTKWPEEPVEPGEEATIKVEYDALKSGEFLKSLAVFYEQGKKPVVLYISGIVDKTLIIEEEPEIEYTNTQGGLAFDTAEKIIGQVGSNDMKKVEFWVKNVSDKKIAFTGRFEKADMLFVKPVFYELAPGQQTTVKVTCVGDRATETGLFFEKVSLHTTDAEQPNKEVIVTGEVVKQLSREELAAAPNILFERTDFVLGNAKEGEKVEYVYKFKNTGRSPLTISKIETSSDAVSTEVSAKNIPGGDEGYIKAIFDTKGRTGRQKEHIFVTTNDIDRPKSKLGIMLDVFEYHVADEDIELRSPLAPPKEIPTPQTAPAHEKEEVPEEHGDKINE